jgi:uncharacterized membrane protein HdeD (DUF308 family)
MVILSPLCVGEYEMKLKHKKLLLIDGIVNLILGVLLLLFPIGIIDHLGLPSTNTNFYPSIFGSLDIPLRGQIILWTIGILVFLIGIAELATNSNIS